MVASLKYSVSLPSPIPVLRVWKVLMTRRRVLFSGLVIFCMSGMLAMLAWALSPGGWSVIDVLIMLAFLVILPWLTVGFCNALMGLLIQAFARDPLRCVNRLAAETDPQAPLTVSTAVLLCVRHESPARLVRNLELLAEGLIASGQARLFHVYVLSDTIDPEQAALEQRAFDELGHHWQGQLALTYRRRESNEGFKAGNIRDFCQRWGHEHDLALVLDADSVMSAQAVLRLVSIMQAQPSLGILQGLVTGTPTMHGFARLFQFGMRLGMRSYTLGSAWWQGDCGPYWGHNAVIRLDAFSAHCELPVLTNRHGKPVHILSHDQIEAVLMRRAGFDVRVYPLEDDNHEENPPNLLAFLARDLRWCAGNMQYWRLIAMPGLQFASRVQLLLALLMFIVAPAWLVMMGLMGWSAHQASLSGAFDLTALAILFVLVVLMMMLPKLASALYVLSSTQRARAFGGRSRFCAAFVVEALFSALLSPVMWVSQTMLLIGLLFGRRIGWQSQNRDGEQVTWGQAARVLAPHTLLGLVLGWLWIEPGVAATWWSAYFLAGLWFSIPLAVLTAKPWFGQILEHWRFAGVPEEFSADHFSSCLRPQALSRGLNEASSRPFFDSSR